MNTKIHQDILLQDVIVKGDKYICKCGNEEIFLYEKEEVLSKKIVDEYKLLLLGPFIGGPIVDWHPGREILYKLENIEGYYNIIKGYKCKNCIKETDIIASKKIKQLFNELDKLTYQYKNLKESIADKLIKDIILNYDYIKFKYLKEKTNQQILKYIKLYLEKHYLDKINSIVLQHPEIPQLITNINKTHDMLQKLIKNHKYLQEVKKGWYKEIHISDKDEIDYIEDDELDYNEENFITYQYQHIDKPYNTIPAKYNKLILESFNNHWIY